MSGLKDMATGSNGNEENTEVKGEQSKSLFAHVYSSRGSNEPDPYKNLDDWEITGEEIRLAHALGAANHDYGWSNSTVRDLLDSYEGGREQWVSEFIIALAHYFDTFMTVQELESQDIEGRGVDPLFELMFGDEAVEEIMDYLSDKPEQAEQVYTQIEERQDEIRQNAEEAAEETEAEADD